MLHEIHLETKKHDEMIDITAQIQNILTNQNIQDDLVVVYCPHTTAGITINENADPDVQRDLLRRLDELYPWDSPKDRHYEFAAEIESVQNRMKKLKVGGGGEYY